MSTLVLLLALIAPQDAGPASRPAAPSADEVRASIARGVRFLLADQNKDGSWGSVRNMTFTDGFANPSTHDAWIVGTTGLASTALLECGPKEEAQPALDRAAAFLVSHADVKRPDSWDIDNVWGFTFGLHGVAHLLASGRFAGSPREAELKAAAATFIDGLDKYQSPNGGWAYYANPNAGWRPEWATSFTTAATVLALSDAKEAGIPVSHAMLEKAVRAVKRCQLPSGAFTYSVEAIPTPGRAVWIDQIKGSLGRMQVCELALHQAGGGVPEKERRFALEQLQENHRFLDVALHKPIPHEAYYFNSGYFYLWAHYYGARLLETLPAADQQKFAPMIQREVMKTQEKDGGMWDFYMSSHGKPYGTSFGIMALQRSLKNAP